jgi:hypothetical protein
VPLGVDGVSADALFIVRATEVDRGVHDRAILLKDRRARSITEVTPRSAVVDL